MACSPLEGNAWWHWISGPDLSHKTPWGKETEREYEAWLFKRCLAIRDAREATDDPEIKQRVLALKAEGHSVPTIAKALGVNFFTIRGWIYKDKEPRRFRR